MQRQASKKIDDKEDIESIIGMVGLINLYLETHVRVN